MDMSDWMLPAGAGGGLEQLRFVIQNDSIWIAVHIVNLKTLIVIWFIVFGPFIFPAEWSGAERSLLTFALELLLAALIE